MLPRCRATAFICDIFFLHKYRPLCKFIYEITVKYIYVTLGFTKMNHGLLDTSIISSNSR